MPNNTHKKGGRQRKKLYSPKKQAQDMRRIAKDRQQLQVSQKKEKKLQGVLQMAIAIFLAGSDFSQIGWLRAVQNASARLLITSPQMFITLPDPEVVVFPRMTTRSLKLIGMPEFELMEMPNFTFTSRPRMSSSDRFASFFRQYHDIPQETPTSRLLGLYNQNKHTQKMIQKMREVDRLNTNAIDATDLYEAMVQGMIDGMLRLSESYDDRQRQRGAYYCGDYFRLYESYEKLNYGLQGRANWNYWSASMKRVPFFAAKDGVDAVDAMGAFLAGPTIMDCASAVSFAMHFGLLRVMGADKFNQVFSPKSHPLSRLIITHTLFDPLTTVEESDLLGNKTLEMIGNPLLPYMDQIYKVYDHDLPDDWISDFDLDLLQVGDIIHIKGAPFYEQKHLAGAGRGWNVIYAGKKGSDEESDHWFAGFWPDQGSVLLTYSDLTRMMNQEYNKPQNDVAREIEAHYTDKSTSTLFDPQTMLMKAQSMLASTMRDDVRDLEDPIVGVILVYRFNPDKIQRLLTESSDLWHQPSFNLDDLLSLESTLLAGVAKSAALDLHTAESRGTTFCAYQVLTDTHADLFQIFGKFATYMVETDRADREFIGLCVTGQAGLGKTHLATATAHLCKLAGLKVLVMDSDKIGEDFQERGGVFADYTRRIEKADLLVMDDINSEYGCGMDILRKMFKVAQTQKKGLIITSNHADIGFFRLTPGLLAFDDRSSLNFYSLVDLEGETYRRPWAPNSVFTEDEADSAITALLQTETELGCGVVIKADNPQKLVPSVTHQLTSNGRTVYLARDPIRDHKVFDQYLHTLRNGSKYDTVVMTYLNDYGYPKQFVTLVKKVHDLGLRAIVLADSSVDLAEKLRYEFRFAAERYEIRITDRVRTVFPGIL